MCTRFVYHGNDMITGFNFDIDLSAWKHKGILKQLEEMNPEARYSLWGSMTNVQEELLPAIRLSRCSGARC